MSKEQDDNAPRESEGKEFLFSLLSRAIVDDWPSIRVKKNDRNAVAWFVRNHETSEMTTFDLNPFYALQEWIKRHGAGRIPRKYGGGLGFCVTGWGDSKPFIAEVTHIGQNDLSEIRISVNEYPVVELDLDPEGNFECWHPFGIAQKRSG